MDKVESRIYQKFIIPHWSKETKFYYGTLKDLHKKHQFKQPGALLAYPDMNLKPVFLVDKNDLKGNTGNAKVSYEDCLDVSLHEFKELALLGYLICNLKYDVFQRVIMTWVKKYGLPCHTALHRYRRPIRFYYDEARSCSTDTVLDIEWELAYEFEKENPDFYLITETTLRGLAYDAYFMYIALLAYDKDGTLLSLLKPDELKSKDWAVELKQQFAEHEFVQAQQLRGRWTKTVYFKDLSGLVFGHVAYEEWKNKLVAIEEKEKEALKLKTPDIKAIQTEKDQLEGVIYEFFSNMVDEYIYRVSSCVLLHDNRRDFRRMQPAYVIPDKLSKVWFDCYNFIVHNRGRIKRCSKPQCSALFTGSDKQTYCDINCRKSFENYRSRHPEEYPNPKNEIKGRGPF